jgi:hypothetical protein
MDTEIAAWAAGVMADGHTLSPAYKDNYIDVKDEATAYKEQKNRLESFLSSDSASYKP